MKKYELDFITYLFSDDAIFLTVNKNMIYFHPVEENDFSVAVVTYNGKMREFLETVAALDIPDTTALCNLKTAAAAALHFIK